MSRNEQVVRTLWNCFGSAKWREAESLLGDGLVVDWFQSKERFIGPKNFVAVNEFYGGTHKIDVLKTTAVDEDKVVSEVEIASKMPDGRELHLFAVSFFEFKHGKIIRAREYWADTYPAPESRKQWRA